MFPRLVAAEHHKPFIGELLESGSSELDALLGGGLELRHQCSAGWRSRRGQIFNRRHLTPVSAASCGARVAMYAFDEGMGTLFARARGLGVPLQQYVDQELVTVQQIDPAEMSPGEFAHLVRDAVSERNAGVVVIDSLNGYLNAMPDERFLVLQLHELLAYLNQVGVLTILVLAQHGLVGHMQTPVDLSYLSDAIIMLR